MTWRVNNLRPLGDGGRGELFLGERSDTGEKVVVKFLRDYANDEDRRWFAREMRILSLHLHKRLMPLLGGDPDAPRPYYIMPYFPGGSLTQWCGRVDDSQLRGAAIQLAEVLASMHNRDVVHGDLKPDNVLMSRDGQLQIADPLGNGGGCTLRYTGNRGGTPGYWAPEIAGGGPMSKEGDVFSYGATLFHLATGRRPDDGCNLDPWAAEVAVPRDLRDLICSCVDSNPASRPSMRQVLATLRPKYAKKLAPASKRGSSDLEDVLKGVVVGGLIVGGLAVLGEIFKALGKRSA